MDVGYRRHHPRRPDPRRLQNLLRPHRTDRTHRRVFELTVGRAPTLRRDGELLGREAGDMPWEGMREGLGLLNNQTAQRVPLPKAKC
jgi:hypothetical protein